MYEKLFPFYENFFHIWENFWNFSYNDLTAAICIYIVTNGP